MQTDVPTLVSSTSQPTSGSKSQGAEPQDSMVPSSSAFRIDTPSDADVTTWPDPPDRRSARQPPGIRRRRVTEGSARPGRRKPSNRASSFFRNFVHPGLKTGPRGLRSTEKTSRHRLVPSAWPKARPRVAVSTHRRALGPLDNHRGRIPARMPTIRGQRQKNVTGHWRPPGLIDRKTPAQSRRIDPCLFA